MTRPPSPPTLATRRLTLRPQWQADAEALVAGLGDFEVARWLSRVPHPYTRADADRVLARQREAPARSWSIYAGGALVGGVGMEDHLGYWIARPHWGLGYATEAARAVLAAHFAEDGADDVESSYFLGNHASRRVLEKLGFVDVGPKAIPCRALGHDVAGRDMRLSRAGWQQATDN